MGIEKDKKSTEANTTLKDLKRRSLNYKKRGDSVNSIEDIPERMSREPDMSPTLKNFKSGGRVNLRGGGMCKKGMNKKAYGRNS